MVKTVEQPQIIRVCTKIIRAVRSGEIRFFVTSRNEKNDHQQNPVFD